MTDNTQELRKRLFKQESHGGWYYFIDADNVPQANIHREAVDKMMEIVLDWHNKQVEAVLDRLESQLQDPNNAEFYDENYDRLMSFDEWLLFERNKVKESK